MQSRFNHKQARLSRFPDVGDDDLKTHKNQTLILILSLQDDMGERSTSTLNMDETSLLRAYGFLKPASVFKWSITYDDNNIKNSLCAF